MKRTRNALICSIVLTFVGLLLIILRLNFEDWGGGFLEAIGISLLSSASIYIVLYYRDFQQDFNEFAAVVLWENNMLADYLTDFKVDSEHIRVRKEKLIRIVKLYESIHALKVIGTTFEPVTLIGKKKRAYLIYEKNLESYVELINFIVKARNEAVRLNNLDFLDILKSGPRNVDEEINSLFYKCRGFAEEYSAIFMENRLEIASILGIEFEHKTETAKENSRRFVMEAKGKFINIKYKGYKYKVNLQSWLYIKCQQSVLIVKRIKRNIYRLIKPMIILFTLLTIFWIAWCMFVAYLGLGNDFLGELCEVRNEYFSSVVVTLFISIYYQNSEYKDKLKQQYFLYIRTLNEFNEITRPFFNDEWCNFHSFYCRESMDYTKCHINSMNIYDDANVELFIAEFNAVYDQVEELYKAFKNGEIIGQEGNDNKELVKYVRESMFKLANIELSESEFREETLELLESLYELVTKVRCPWIWDLGINKKIALKLKENDSRLLDDFYTRMKVYDFDVIFNHEME